GPGTEQTGVLAGAFAASISPRSRSEMDAMAFSFRSLWKVRPTLARGRPLGRRTVAAPRQSQPATPAAVADPRDDRLREVRAAGRGERVPPVAVEHEEQV